MIWRKKINVKLEYYIRVILILIFSILYSCQNQQYEDTRLEYDQLPDQVKRKFNETFESNVTNNSFIIFKCVEPKLNCDHQTKSILIFNSKIVLSIADKTISIPSDQTAVRIFIYYDNKLYYIKRSGFSRLEGGKIGEFLDYKNEKYSVFEVD